MQENRAIFIFGVVFLIVIVVIALLVPIPTGFQASVFRIVLALAAAGVAAMIPGLIQFEISNWVRAGGAMAVFVIVYFKNPAQIGEQPSPRTSSIPTNTVQLLSPRQEDRVPRSATFTGLVNNLPSNLRMWAYVKGSAEGRYYLKEILKKPDSGNGPWRVDQVLIGRQGKEDSGAEYEVGVVLSNPAESTKISQNRAVLGDLPGQTFGKITVYRE